jgi:hypothetical protein
MTLADFAEGLALGVFGAAVIAALIVFAARR